MGISLWLVPSASDAKRIETIMHIKPNDPTVSATSYAKFHPHITLASLGSASEIELEAIKASIPKLDTPLKCGFCAVTVGDTYFRSVYIAIKPSMDVLDLHKRVHETLGLEPKTPCFPHLSLVYIDDEDAKKGERAIYYDLLKQAGKFIEVDAGSNNTDKEVSLKCVAENGEIGMNYFEATEVWAVKCEGPVEGWQVLAKYPLVISKS